MAGKFPAPFPVPFDIRAIYAVPLYIHIGISLETAAADTDLPLEFCNRGRIAKAFAPS